MAAWVLPICLVTGHAATAAQPNESNTATRGYSAAALFNQANACARDGRAGAGKCYIVADEDCAAAARSVVVKLKGSRGNRDLTAGGQGIVPLELQGSAAYGR